MLQIEEIDKRSHFVLWALGFRPFFLGAGIFAVLSIGLWMAQHSLQWDVGLTGLAPITWHAHEMIFGYAMAVVAGFLLTAVKNWTGVQTLHGVNLALPFLFWAGARLGPFIDSMAAMAVLDLLFMVYLTGGVLHPVIKSKSWKQMGIVSKVVLMLGANLLFYLGVFGVLDQGVAWGLYSGLYLILALMMAMGRRVIPFFIENALGIRGQLKNWLWLDISSLVFLLVFIIFDVFTAYAGISALFAAILFVLHSIRLVGWYAPGMWTRPIVWVLYIAYAAMTAGFLMKAATWQFGLSPYVATHMFAVGGIGIMTLGMMSRVALGHTGRDINKPSPAMSWTFLLLLAGTVFRVLFPLVDNGHYSLWIVCSQILWIAAFAGFVFIYFPVLVRSRVDGRPG